MSKTNDKFRLLDILNARNGYDIALMTSFNFDIRFFEQALLNSFLASDLRKISLFVDSEEFAGSLQSVRTCQIGRKYMVNPIRMQSSFHPKVTLLLGEKKARLIIGSSNITTPGYTTNNEVFNFIDYTEKDPKYLDLIVDAIDFFSAINNLSDKLDSGLIEEAKAYSYYHRTRRNGETYFLHNIESSILSQVQQLIPEPVKSIRVAVPYYDRELAAYKEICATFPEADIQLYIQNKKSTYPVDFAAEHEITGSIHPFEGFLHGQDNYRNNFYHGKVFLFQTEQKSYVLYGSANCTQSALLRSYSTGGNIEGDLFEIGGPGEFDYFFDNIRIEDRKELVCQTMTYAPSAQSGCVFKYGEIAKDIQLHFMLKEKGEIPEIWLRDNKLSVKINGQELIASISRDKAEGLTDIFEVTISYANKTETCLCWVFNQEKLKRNREKGFDSRTLKDFDMDPDSGKYLEDCTRLLEAELMCLPDLEEFREKSSVFEQIREEADQDDNDNSEFVVDVEIPDEYRSAYKQYQYVEKIRGIFTSRFFSANSGCLLAVPPDRSLQRGETLTINVSPTRVVRPPTTEEIRFERFVRRRVKGMLNDRYIEAIEMNHYLALMRVVFDIYDKYTNNPDEEVKKIFRLDYVMETSSTLLCKALEKDYRENDGIYGETTAILMEQSYKQLIKNYGARLSMSERSDQDKFDQYSKMLLTVMENLHSIRNTYRKELAAVAKGNTIDMSRQQVFAFVAYIDNLFGYKGKQQLTRFIESVYDHAEVDIAVDKFYIHAGSRDITRCYKPDIRVLQEIKKYSRNVRQIKSVIIIIDNDSKTSENGKRMIRQIEHRINLDLNRWECIIVNSHFGRRIEKPQYINI